MKIDLLEIYSLANKLIEKIDEEKKNGPYLQHGKLYQLDVACDDLRILVNDFKNTEKEKWESIKNKYLG